MSFIPNLNEIEHMSLSCLGLWALGATALAADRGARADDAAYAGDDAADYVPAPRDRLWYSNSTFARVNPLGLVNTTRVGWQRRLSTSDHVLRRDTYTFVGPSLTVTPAWGRAGLYAESQLLAVLRVFGEVNAVGYFGTFDQVLTFPADGRYSDQSIEARGVEAEPRAGWIVNVGGTARAAVGPFALRSTLQLTRIDLAGGSDGAYFYEQLTDRLAPDGGWLLLDDTDVLYVGEALRLGARYTVSETLDGSVGTDAALAHHRLGPLFAWQFSDDPPGDRFNQPTLFVLAQWWLQHPYRSGDEQPAGLPLIAVGFAFNGDLGKAP